MLPATLLALMLVPHGSPVFENQAGGTQAGGVQTGGNPIPPVRDDVPSTEFLTWRGWTYLQGATAAPAILYEGIGDWSSIASAKPVEGAAVWRTKFVVFRSVERLGRDQYGILRSDRETIEDNQMEEVRHAIQRLGLFLTAASGGRVRLEAEVAEEKETMRGPLGAEAFGAPFALGYLRPRLNGGGYEAEDRVYRGPYHSVICLLPATIQPPDAATQVHGMPVRILSIERQTRPFVAGVLDSELRQITLEHARERASSRGFDGVSTEGAAADDAWLDLTKTAEPTGAEMTSHTGPLRLGAAVAEPPPSRLTWRTPRADASLVADSEKGQVIRLYFRGPTRAMGLAFPGRSDGQPLVSLSDAKTLNLTLRTLAKDPLAIRLEGKDGKRAWVALQPEILLPQTPGLPILVAPIKADGTWEKLAVDIGPLAKTTGIEEVTALAMEFTPRGRQTMRTLSEPMEIFLDDVHFSNDPASGTIDPSTEADAKVRTAIAATASSPELIAMLSDRNALVRLNAADAYTRIKDPAAEDALATLAIGIDSSIADRALHALAFQGTETASAGIRRAVRMAINDHSRAVAALMLAEGKDPRNAGEISVLYAHRSWQTRLAAVHALGKLPGRPAAIARYSALAQDNPEIKLAVIDGVDPTDEAIVRRLLWPSVNEPLDVVRAYSALKLIQSPLPELKKEGYKAVRDDSATVRRIVLEALAAQHDEAHRDAFRLGIADRSPSVRAAAVLGFASLEKGASDEELTPALEDVHPAVQVALVEYAVKRKTKLPGNVIERMKNSPFANVRAAVARIAG